MTVRLQKVIADSGLCSRRKAETLIEEGRVTVNGKVASIGDVIDPGVDIVEVDGQPIHSEKKVYLLLNKPPRYECTLESTTGKPLATELVDTGARIFPVGRLDTDSRGLLILTNDGDFANRVMHPSTAPEKEYEVTVQGKVREMDAAKLSRGVDLDGQMTRPCRVSIAEVDKNTTKLVFVIHEGRKRQLRRMLDYIGHKVIDLKRVRIGRIKLKDLAEGQYRALAAEEVESLLENVGGDTL